MATLDKLAQYGLIVGACFVTYELGKQGDFGPTFQNAMHQIGSVLHFGGSTGSTGVTAGTSSGANWKINGDGTVTFSCKGSPTSRTLSWAQVDQALWGANALANGQAGSHDATEANQYASACQSG